MDMLEVCSKVGWDRDGPGLIQIQETPWKLPDGQCIVLGMRNANYHSKVSGSFAYQGKRSGRETKELLVQGVLTGPLLGRFHDILATSMKVCD